MLTNENQLPSLPAGPGEYVWRAARREDAEAIHRLLLDIEAVDRRSWVDTMEDRHRDFDDPASNFETDSLLALTQAGEVAALGWIFAPPVGETEFIAYLWGEIHPEHRRRGLGSMVLSWMEARGHQILASRPDDLPHYLRTSSLDHLQDRAALFEQHGFQPVRYGFRMRRDLHQPFPEAPMPEDIQLARWDPALDLAVLEACNEAFRDHWGFIPVPEEVWHLWLTQHPYFRPELTFLALAKDTGPGENPVAGFSINQVRQEENQATGINEGWIQELGVRRNWRKRGVATALLCASLQAFKQAGLDYAGLGVDTENLTGALRIYERLGFEPIKRSITFSKGVEG
jgi:mycothiol synthase